MDARGNRKGLRLGCRNVRYVLLVAGERTFVAFFLYARGGWVHWTLVFRRLMTTGASVKQVYAGRGIWSRDLGATMVRSSSWEALAGIYR